MSRKLRRLTSENSLPSHSVDGPMTETLTHAEWFARGTRLFGPNTDEWKFVCPTCGNIAAVGDFRPFAEQGAVPSSATCECIGRYTGAKTIGPGIKPCNYAGYGLFRLSPLRVMSLNAVEVHCFAFAEVA